jgi:CoA:oxalate CoA-transferase
LLREFDKVPGVERSLSVVRAGFRLSSGDPAPGFPPPTLGAHTRAVLAEIGYGAQDIAMLAQDGVI